MNLFSPSDATYDSIFIFCLLGRSGLSSQLKLIPELLPGLQEVQRLSGCVGNALLDVVDPVSLLHWNIYDKTLAKAEERSYTSCYSSCWIFHLIMHYQLQPPFYRLISTYLCLPTYVYLPTSIYSYLFVHMYLYMNPADQGAGIGLVLKYQYQSSMIR